MAANRKYATVVATFSVALGIGFVMQYGDAVASRRGADALVGGPSTAAPATPLVPVKVSGMATHTMFVPEVKTPTAYQTAAVNVPQEFDTPRLDPVERPTLAAVVPDEELPITDPVIVPEVVATRGCEHVLTATPMPLAMVALTLDAPCNPNEVVAFHHQGMMFNAVTDETGFVTVEVPALEQEAFFIAALNDGEGAVAMTGVPELALYDRAVLQWQGAPHVELHALEFGAGYGEAGHVWMEFPGDPDLAGSGSGGFLTRLGVYSDANDALFADVYTFPSGMSGRDGRVSLSVEAMITDGNCGQEISAQSIQISTRRDPVAVDMHLLMPECDAVGDVLLLKNMFEDLTLASK